MKWPRHVAALSCRWLLRILGCVSCLLLCCVVLVQLSGASSRAWLEVLLEDEAALDAELHAAQRLISDLSGRGSGGPSEEQLLLDAVRYAKGGSGHLTNASMLASCQQALAELHSPLSPLQGVKGRLTQAWTAYKTQWPKRKETVRSVLATRSALFLKN